MVTVGEYVYLPSLNLDCDHLLKLHQKTGLERSLEFCYHSKGSITLISNIRVTIDGPVFWKHQWQETGGPPRRSCDSLTVTRG